MSDTKINAKEIGTKEMEAILKKIPIDEYDKLERKEDALKKVAVDEMDKIKSKIASLELAKNPSFLAYFLKGLFVYFLVMVLFLVLAGIGIFVFTIFMAKSSSSEDGAYFLVIAISIAILVGLVGWIYLAITNTKKLIKEDKKKAEQKIEDEKKRTTCPNCEKSLVWFAMPYGDKALDKDYKTKVVREGFGDDSYKRKGVFVYGTKEVSWFGFCLECGHIKHWEEVVKYEQEV